MRNRVCMILPRLCTLKNKLASDCDDIGVQLSMGRRTLLAATLRLIDGVPSENNEAVSKEFSTYETLTKCFCHKLKISKNNWKNSRMNLLAVTLTYLHLGEVVEEGPDGL